MNIPGISFGSSALIYGKSIQNQGFPGTVADSPMRCDGIILNAHVVRTADHLSVGIKYIDEGSRRFVRQYDMIPSQPLGEIDGIP